MSDGNPDFEALRTAYENTTYVVQAETAEFRLRVGARHPNLDAWLAGLGYFRWAFLSAANPESRRLSEFDNQSRNARLRKMLETFGKKTFPALGAPDGSDWPPEPSLFVPDLGREGALALGESFKQWAVLVGEARGPAELAWTSKVKSRRNDLRKAREKA